MPSIFTKIINRERPADIFFEDEKYMAILDINPIRDGHILVIPKKEIDYIFDLNEEEYTELMQVSRKVGLMLEEKIKDKLEISRIAIIVEGMQVPHVHVHLVPLFKEDSGLSVGRKTKLSLEEIRKILFS